MIKFKFVGFIVSFLTAILVITNGNGSLFQNVFGDSDSIEDSVDEIVESAEEESDDVRDEAEDIAEEARENADIDDDVRDRDNDEDEVEDEDDNNNYDDTSSDLESEVEDKVREVEDNVEEDDIEEIPGLGEGSGMQIFVSPREIRNGAEGLVNDIKNQVVDEYNNNDDSDTDNENGGLPGSLSPGKCTINIDQTTGEFTYDPDDDFARAGGTDTFIEGVGASPGNVPIVPRLDLTFDEDIDNLSIGIGNEGNHIPSVVIPALVC